MRRGRESRRIGAWPRASTSRSPGVTCRIRRSTATTTCTRTSDALTKFLPPEYEGVVKYVEINGRTKLAINDRISDYIPNPTFDKVAVPGGARARHHQGRRRRAVRRPGRRFRPKCSMPSIDAFFDPEPRLALMKDMGIDRTLLWPTLASVLEERLADDPDAACAVVHALNQWMHEHWSYVYADAIYATPIISLAVAGPGARGAASSSPSTAPRSSCIRVAPVPTWKGRKSFALPEFDPFWERVQELDIVVGMHSGDPGYQRYINEWEGIGDRDADPFKRRRASPAFLALSSEKDNLVDAHGVDHRPRPGDPVPAS